MFDLEDIRAFVEVAETGSLGQAARRLGGSTSMVSRRLTRLEAELGAALLLRSTRGVVLTEAGANFRPYADRALAELEAARDAVAQDGAEVTGALRIAAPLSFGSQHLAPVLAELGLRHPRLAIETDYADRMVNLAAERFDAAVRIGALPDSSLIARKIAPINLAIVASPAYLERAGTPAVLADLDAHAALIQPGETWRFTEAGRPRTVNPTVRFRANSGQALAQAAIAGLGVAVLPTFLTGHALGTGALLPLLPDVTLPAAGLYLVRPPAAGPAPAKVRVLADILIERFGGDPVWDACWLAAQAKKQER